jgi:hypothetical protein
MGYAEHKIPGKPATYDIVYSLLNVNISYSLGSEFMIIFLEQIEKYPNLKKIIDPMIKEIINKLNLKTTDLEKYAKSLSREYILYMLSLLSKVVNLV